MLIRKGFRFRLKTNAKHNRILTQFAGSCRFVWNKAFAFQKERLEAGAYCLGYKSLCELLKAWKDEASMKWLQENPSQPLQHFRTSYPYSRCQERFFAQSQHRHKQKPRSDCAGRFKSIEHEQIGQRNYGKTWTHG